MNDAGERNAKTRVATLQTMLHDMERHGERPALRAHGARDIASTPYAGLCQRLAGIAGGLAGSGVRPGDRVLVMGSASPAWILCALGLIRAGAVPVPVDAQIGDEHLAHVVGDCGARHAFVDRRFADRLHAASEGILDPWLLDPEPDDANGWQGLREVEGGIADQPGADDEAVLFYTSGTTGRPKGVPLSHRNLSFQLEQIAALDMLQGDDRVLLPLPLHHVYPFVVGLLATLAAGACLVLPRSLTGPQVRRALQDSEATAVVGIPRLYAALLAAVRRQVRSQGRLAAWWLRGVLAFNATVGMRVQRQVRRRLLRPVHRELAPALRLLASGGAALDPALQRDLEAFGWQVISGYGLTETAPLLAVKRPDEGPPGCAGRPVAGIELRIADRAQGGDEARAWPPGYGEVLARGPGVFSGYLNLPDKTAEVLDEDGWFHTGDLGRIDDQGFLHLAGRVSTMIVTPGGENVQPEDVEAAYEKHPLIDEIGVLQQDGRLVGVVLPDRREAGERSGEDLRQALRRALDEAGRGLASYQRLQDFVITRARLERTRLGKLRRHRLSARYAEAGEEDDATTPQSPEESLSAEDRTLLEDPVASAAWELLQARFEDRPVTPGSSLRFDLGVDSLDWLDLALALRDATGVELDDDAIARVETVRDLLEALLEAGPATEDPASLFEQPEAALDDDDLGRLRRPGALAATLGNTLYVTNRGLVGATCRLRVHGAEDLPGDGRPFLLAPNHLSYLDPFVLAAALGAGRMRETFWAGWTGAVFDTALKRRLARLARVLPIDPAGGPRRNLAFAAAALNAGYNLVWFPEGTRSPDGTLQSFRHGIGLLLAHLDVRVVPVAIRGTHGVLPPGRRLPRRGPVSVRFGTPLAPVDLGADSAQGAAEDRAERIVAGLHEHLARLLEAAAEQDGHPV